MARPLKESKIKKMDLTVKLFNGESKKLGKQIGFNRYVVDNETKEIATLSQELKKKGDALLILEDHGKDYPVIKIVENLFHTAHKPYAYVLDADGKVVFLEEGISVYGTHADVTSVDEIENMLNESGNVSAEFNDDITINSDKPLTVNNDQSLELEFNGENTNINSSSVIINNGGEANITFNTDVSSEGSEPFVVNGGKLTVEGVE